MLIASCNKLSTTASHWELSRVSTAAIQDGLTTGSTVQQMAARIDKLKQNKPDGSPTAPPNITALKAKIVALQTIPHHKLQLSVRYSEMAFSSCDQWQIHRTRALFLQPKKVQLALDPGNPGNREASKGYCARTPPDSLNSHSNTIGLLSVYGWFIVV